MAKTLWIEIPPCIHQEALRAFWHSVLVNYGLTLAPSADAADALICMGETPIPDQSKAQFFCLLDLQMADPNSFAPCEQTGFWAPQGMQVQQKGSLSTANLDLISFLAGALFRAPEYRESLAKASLNAQSQDLNYPAPMWEQPFVDQWVRWILEALFGPLQTIWQKRGLRYWLSHDVDHLLRWNWKRILWHCATSPWKIFSWQNWRNQSRSMLKSIFQDVDPLDCIEQVLQADAPRQSSFFVLGWPKDHQIRRYDVRKKRFRRSLLQIPNYGAEIGLHGSPLHTSSLTGIAKEKKRVEESLHCRIRAQRMHFLRFDLRNTPKALSLAGIELDASLGFNDRPGFRCGSAMPFYWYDWQNQSPTQLLMMPLIYADHQRQDWLHSQNPALIQELQGYLERTDAVGAPCSLLFHDLYFSSVILPKHPEFYQDILQKCHLAPQEHLSLETLMELFKAHEMV